MILIRKSDQPVNTWSGGTTRQIYIFPEDSTYAARNFKIRISTATIETERSVFTALPGYFRRLTVLAGELKLEHREQHVSVLKKFDTDSFQGQWETTSYGKAIDFNAMSVEQYDVKVHPRTMAASDETMDYELPVEKVGIYVHSGELQVEMHGKNLALYEGDFILLEHEECRNMARLYNTLPVEIIVVTIEKLC